MKGKSLFIILLIAFISSVFLYSQWAKSYGGDDPQTGHSIKQTMDGGYIVGGYTGNIFWNNTDILIMKLSENGDIQWQKTYRGDGNDEAQSVEQTIDGGYIVGGFTDSCGQGGGDILVLKLFSNGDIQWQHTYGGEYSEGAPVTPISIKQTLDGGYIVGGTTRSFPSSFRKWVNNDIWILKLYENGDIEWQKTYGGDSDDEARSIQQTSDGGYIVSGYTNSFGAGEWDAWIIKLTSSGDIEWQKTYGGSGYDHATFIGQTSDGGYITTGYTLSFGPEGGNLWVLKLSSKGEISWQRTYSGYEDDVGRAVIETFDKGYMVAGQSYSFNPRGYKFWFIKTYSNGDIEWQGTFGDKAGGSEYLYSLDQLNNGDYVATGWTENLGADWWDLLVVRLSANGNIGRCGFGGESTAEVTETSIVPTDTHVIPFDTDAMPYTSDLITTEANFGAFNICPSGKKGIIRR